MKEREEDLPAEIRARLDAAYHAYCEAVAENTVAWHGPNEHINSACKAYLAMSAECRKHGLTFRYIHCKPDETGHFE